MTSVSFRKTAHYNGGTLFFAYGYTCVEHPEVTRFVRYDKRTNQVSEHWRFHGFEVASLLVAVEAAVSARAGERS